MKEKTKIMIGCVILLIVSLAFILLYGLYMQYHKNSVNDDFLFYLESAQEAGNAVVEKSDVVLLSESEYENLYAKLKPFADYAYTGDIEAVKKMQSYIREEDYVMLLNLIQTFDTSNTWNNEDYLYDNMVYSRISSTNEYDSYTIIFDKKDYSVYKGDIPTVVMLKLSIRMDTYGMLEFESYGYFEQ